MLSSRKPRNGLKLHIIYLGIAGVFCISCLILSSLVPRLNFDVGVQGTPTGMGVVVKRVYGGNDNVQSGDVIEAVAGKSVQTKAALYHQLLYADDQVELTIRRLGNKFQRPVSASDFAHGALPSGVRTSDRPVLIMGDDGEYTPLDGVDFDALRGILESRSGAVSVVFRRQEEIVNSTIELRSATGRTFGASLIFLLLVLMGVVAWRDQKCQKQLLSNLTLGLGCMSLMTLGLWSTILTMPLLLMIGMVSLTMFKVIDLDAHLMSPEAGGHRIELWGRIALYAGPAATLFVPVILCLRELPVLWGGAVEPGIELKPEAFAYLSLLWCVIYTLVDGGVSVYRHYRDRGRALCAFEIGVAFSCFLSVFVFVLLRSDMQGAQWFLMAMILIQSVSNILPDMLGTPKRRAVRLDDPVFGLAPVREALACAQSAVGSQWLVHAVIDRPSPKHVISLSVSDDDDAVSGIALNVLPQAWRDFLEVFRIEGVSLTGEARDTDGRDPVQGIADRLGIAVALPIADNVAGTLTSLTLLISSVEVPENGEFVPLSLSPSQRGLISDVIERLTECAPAMVYQSAEMSLEFVGDEIDDDISRYQSQSEFARPTKTPTAPLDMHDLPHGLIDEEELEAEDHEASDAVPETPAQPGNNENTGYVLPDRVDTKVYEEEVFFLRSQVHALNSQQLREFSLSEIEYTEAQREAFEDMNSIDPPILLIGEPGTGKRLLALAAHQRRSTGAFLCTDAAEVPESIFALDLFGDGENPGLIKGAAGGSLLIQNVDRLSSGLLDEILETIEGLPARESVGLYLSVNVSPDTFSVAQYRLEPLRLPRYLRELSSRSDAEIIVLDPLRKQVDLDVLAEFFLQKQAIRANRTVESFTPEAMLALKSYHWPGNFSEMRAVVERAVLRASGSMITVADLGRDFEKLADASTKNMALTESDVFREQVQHMESLNEAQLAQIQSLNARILQLEAQLAEGASGTQPVDDTFLEGSFNDIEKRLLDRLLDKYQRDPDKAAEALGMNRARFFNKLSKYQLVDTVM
ncbi:MAG: sigma 54-interacting transcriptional regulator [Proteobacteria bacterium]|nr:sigma 54-interacting transcriptional regulator [Pseudomonadota bacterium]